MSIEKTYIQPKTYPVLRWVVTLLVYLLLAAVFVVCIFPLVWLVLTSFKEQFSVFIGPLWPEKFILDNYRRIWVSLDLARHFYNTLLVTTLTVLGVTLFSAMAGYAFSKLEFPGRELIFLVFIASLTIPAQVTLIPLFILLRDMSLLNTHAGLIASYIGMGLAFSIFLLRAFFHTLPSELIDAGRIDGASELRIFSHIMLPLAKPGLATVVIFQSVGTWNEFMYAATFLHEMKLRTLQPALHTLIGRYSTDWGALCAGMVIALLPIIITFLILQRQFIQGLTAGAIKG